MSSSNVTTEPKQVLTYKLASDTIVAISTPQGVGGTAVVRISGARALETVRKFVNKAEIVPRRATLARFVYRNELIDELVITWFNAPHSYTGEDVVELSCHGSSYIQSRLLQLLIDEGLRLAEPGEFTRRAFINGRMNLAQAEAVADLIDATNETTHKIAIKQLRKGYTELLASLRAKLIELTSLLELELDFSDEDLQFADRSELEQILSALQQQTDKLIGSFEHGNAIKKGVATAIIGLPNAGKSSLLNALLSDDRALVSNIPGTTRDTIEEVVTIAGVPIRFIDTAGLRQSADELEQMGIDRTYNTLKNAEIVLFVHDVTALWEVSNNVLSRLKDAGSIHDDRLIIIENKCDLLHICNQSPVPIQGNETYSTVKISTQNSDGIDTLRKLIAEKAQAILSLDDDVIITNARHYEALKNLQTALSSVGEGLKANISSDLIAIDCRQALYYIGLITGEVHTDDLLDSIFSNFCIGK